MPFSDIIGHSRQLEILKAGLQTGRLHHAYLFWGPEGVGKRTVALSLAMAIHCPARGDDTCGRCQDCLSIGAGNHPDVRWIEPLEGKKEIGIQQIRELERELSFRSFSGKTKVAIIDPADLMNYHAQNSLLKTLEEPAGDSVLILIARSPGRLLPTLLSRCLRFSFGFPPVDRVAEFLVRQKGMPAEQAGLLAALTMGSLGEALNSDARKLLDQRREWIERLCSLAQGDYQRLITLSEEVASDREKSLSFLRWVEGWYRDLLIYQMTGQTGELRHIDMVETIQEQAKLYSVDHTLAVLSRVARVIGEIQRNYNRRLALEDFLLRAVGGSSC